jgi:hypothetical protein
VAGCCEYGNEHSLSISDFRLRREVRENCDLLGYYAAISGNFLPTFRDNLSVSSSGVENQDGTDRLSRNVDKKLPLLAA